MKMATNQRVAIDNDASASAASWLMLTTLAGSGFSSYASHNTSVNALERPKVNLTVYILYANRNSQMRLSSDSPQRLDIFLVLAVRRA